MKLDLLFKSERQLSKSDVCRTSGLDECFSIICPDLTKRQKFLDIVSSPLTNTEDIIYRQNNLKEFLAAPELINALRGISDEITLVKTAWDKNRLEQMRTLGDNSHGSLAELVQAQCRLSAGLLKALLIQLKKLGEPGITDPEKLGGLISWARMITMNAGFDELLKLCGKLEYRSSSLPADIRVRVENGLITQAELTEHRFIAKKPEKRSIFRKKETLPEEKTVSFFPNDSSFYKRLSTAAFSSLAAELDGAAKQIFDILSNLGDDLIFYEVAISLRNYLAAKGIVSVFPEFGNEVSIDRLYDLKLICTFENVSGIVPQELNYSGNLIICGGNSCGKSVFLRSVASAQLLAQAGLFIPAKSARLKVFEKVAILYAGDAAKDSDSGDFEEEVKRMSGLVDSGLCNSLILLNEPFQTTAYAEGAVGLCGLLKYFEDIGAAYMITTHMTKELLPIVKSDNVRVMEFGNDHVGKIKLLNFH